MKSSFVALAAASTVGSAYAQGQAYAQCGGVGWSGSTTCVSGYTCQKTNDYYSQCVPGGGSSPTTTTRPSTTTTSRAGGSSPTGGSGSGRVSNAGVNIAGLDFGCTIDGTCKTANIVDPGQIGIDQIQHFIKDDGLNTFRLPVGWQFLLNNNLGGTLDSNNWATYDKLVQGCLNAGAALCIVDIHNYARWNGGIVGQGGPTNAQFTSLWSQIAAKYKGNTRIAFGLMNEPHDLNINTWATTVQEAVTAIRKAGATGNKILLPGTDFTSAGAFISNGSGGALIKVVNLDGTTNNLIFDVHKYLDSDNSGTHTTCTTNNADAFTSLGNWLRTNKRQAILTETGGGATDSSCLKAVCEQLDVLNNYSDVYLGWTGWSAGRFDATYELTETPTRNSNGGWTDVPLVTQCIAGKFKR